MNAKKPGCMFIDKKGNVVLSLEDYSCYGGFFPDEGKVVIYEDDSYEDDWYTVGTFSDEGLALINKDGKWGLMDKAGKIVTDCVYGGVLGYSEGYYQVRKDGKDGFVDDYFKEVIPCKYYMASTFKEGVAKVCVDRDEWNAGKWSLIDTNGNIIIPDAKDIDDFYEGVAVYKKNDRFGYVDKYGNEVIPSIFESAGHFSEGLASVKKNGMFGYIDKNGIETIPFIYEDAKDFSEGLALVKKNDRWGYVDKKGKSTFDYQ